ncbi:MAG: DUF979 domain-containing protein [Candidatus Cellulosilyticum pullistercoris]|uniref:DUF979 domain-containing protein n=1 Tax=Candidatus Cellulosilyticum pullistercoris TaxID=2838521 RepID=A0A9E2NMK5_9FIRM|nr:DUF979 domain-containing protein [Candidatus Cellulosilyticum pullistercoris]
MSNSILLEVFYVCVGLLMYLVAFNILKDPNSPARVGTTLFWGILGTIFVFGSLLPGAIVGILLVGIGILTATKQVKVGKVNTPTHEFSAAKAKLLGNKVFIPSITIAILVICIAKFTSYSGTVAIGIAAIITIILTLCITKADIKTVKDDSNRMLQAVGVTCILPQLLAALGSLFTAAGTGDVIANNISNFIPQGNILIGVIAYCLGMALFTMIMGNAFAAFSVITVGIGVPFVFMQGGDIVICSTLALTAGYCGTLMTPMAANFNILPVALLNMKNKNAVIKYQSFIAIPLLLVHIILMYFLGF